jgi:2-polyprenyl-6-methoxyphenol hydroxylase-like FAD-dependent oxidoreductase
MLAYLLARGGVAVTLLESRPDFDRQFRGDTLAPPVLELLDALGLADPLLASVPHGTADAFMWSTPTRSYRLADYRRTSAK